MAKRIKQQLNPYPYQNFTCDSCREEYEQQTAYSPAPDLEQLDYFYTYCSNCAKVNAKETKKQPNKSKKTKDFGIPPLEASENLRSLEIDKRTLRKTNRIHQFNTSVSEEWMTKLKTISYKERLKYVEVLEKALECYENQRK